MTLPVRLTPAAEQDILLAQRWYLAQAPRVLASSTNHEIQDSGDGESEPDSAMRVPTMMHVTRC